MTVLHIASISNSPFSGVSVAVPQHVLSQKEYAETGFLNIRNIEIDRLKDTPGTQMEYRKPFHLRELPKPFNEPDLVIFHECYQVEYLRIAAELRKNGVPYVIMPHGELRDSAQKKKRLKKMAANLLLFNRFINGAIALQCVSRAEEEGTRFGKKKILVTNGVDIPPRMKETFSPDGIRLLYIGRLEVAVKGLDLMIEAAALARDQMTASNATLAIYGPDYQGRYAQVEELIRNAGVGDLVLLHHEVTGAEKEQLLLDADVFIQTSRYEGMPMGILEAMSYGLPCLVTEGTSLGETIEDHSAGWSAGNSAREIADALEQALKEKEKFGLYGRNGREFVRETFSWSGSPNKLSGNMRN